MWFDSSTLLPEAVAFLKKALEPCTEATRSRVYVAFQISRNLLGLTCDTVTPPPLCDIAEVRKCIFDLYTLIDETKDAEKYCRYNVHSNIIYCKTNIRDTRYMYTKYLLEITIEPYCLRIMPFVLLL